MNQETDYSCLISATADSAVSHVAEQPALCVICNHMLPLEATSVHGTATEYSQVCCDCKEQLVRSHVLMLLLNFDFNKLCAFVAGCTLNEVIDIFRREETAARRAKSQMLITGDSYVMLRQASVYAGKIDNALSWLNGYDIDVQWGSEYEKSLKKVIDRFDSSDRQIVENKPFLIRQQQTRALYGVLNAQLLGTDDCN